MRGINKIIRKGNLGKETEIQTLEPNLWYVQNFFGSCSLNDDGGFNTHHN
jgi:hypothetical protein